MSATVKETTTATLKATARDAAIRPLAITCALLAACASAQAAPPDAGTAPTRAVIKRGNDPMFLLHGGDPFVIARRGHLGIELHGLNPELREHFGAPKDAGVLVASVTPDSPAAKAGVRVGDVLTAIDGEKIVGAPGLNQRIRSKADKETVTLEVVRNRSRQNLKVQIEHKETKELDLGGLMFNDHPRFHFDGKQINDAVNQAMKNLKSSDFTRQFELRRESEEKLQQRTRALEDRIEKLEKQLQGKK
jgi:membrane-associated protease RseP (regulator of RpoE activity)